MKPKFILGNAKIPGVWTFSLPAGWTCPGARECLCKANRETGKVTDGPDTKFRCFAASDERYTATRMGRWHNFELLKGKSTAEMVDILHPHLPKAAKIVRIHVSGDFFSQAYFDAWLEVARRNPETLFYAYTKSLKFWVERMNEIPKNLKLNASRGGLLDALIDKVRLKSAEVVFSEADAENRGLEIDHNDSLAYGQDKSFALLIHGTQPAGSLAAKALSALRKLGKTGYGKKLALAALVWAGGMDGIRYQYWPVWARPYNENILSRVIWFDGDMA
jgi:hypothetical protein